MIRKRKSVARDMKWLGFRYKVAGKTGEDICQQILEKLAVDDIDIGQCRGQSYDNGSNMASIHKEVQAWIAEKNELAEFVPCLAHSLNLVGVHSASSCQEAINLFGPIQKKEGIILARSVALMDGLLKTLQKMKQNPLEYRIKEVGELAEKCGVDPILENKRIPKRKKKFDEMCEEELPLLQPVQLFSKEIMMVFDRIISEIKKRFDCATMLNLNFAFLNGTNILKMSNEELQKYGGDLARKYERDLSAVALATDLWA
nr:unnamed protein product [Callosobruchus analis]